MNEFFFLIIEREYLLEKENRYDIIHLKWASF